MNPTMKVFALLAMAVSATAVVTQDNTITKVVKLLQGMLDKSVTEGDTERKIFAKFKCYCDQNEAEKTQSIDDGKETIALLESKIEEIQGDTGGLSSECADLKAKMADNKAARDEAQTLRNKENKAFEAEEQDLKQGIKQMSAAIETLSAVGADQTKSTGADNKQFMAGMTLLQANAQDALRAATAFMTPEQQHSATAFLQGPFTGTYTSQSGVVMGILKSMRDTFIANLESARDTEKKSEDAHNKFMELKKSAFDEMKDSYQAKQKALGGNDGGLSSKRKQLREATKTKASDEEFLEKLLPMCEDKAKAYATRKVLRANEEVAIAEAVSILNSDDAFATFGGADSTSSGATGFLQLRSLRRHTSGDVQAAERVLKKAAQSTQSARLSKAMALLQGDNPFDSVLKEIDNMIELIGEEGKADQEKLDWCNKERKDSKAKLNKKKREITSLDKTIDGLEKDINHPKKGLLVMIQETETKLDENDKAQKTETAQRLQENVAYQKDVKNLVTAEDILTRATNVLKAYYDDLEEKLEAGSAAFVQEDPAPPQADLNMSGQSSKGGDVIGMLKFILKETKDEEGEAHADEEKAQADYEDSMTSLKKEQAEAEKSLSDLQDTLAEKEKDLLENQEDLKATTEEKEALQDYLEKIKPGCDFITKNFDTREKNRSIEKSALEKAVGLIEATPAYKAAVNDATVESYGDCKEPCVKNKGHVKCKACMSDVTIPAYCAGHKGTPGC